MWISYIILRSLNCLLQRLVWRMHIELLFILFLTAQQVRSHAVELTVLDTLGTHTATLHWTYWRSVPLHLLLIIYRLILYRRYVTTIFIILLTLFNLLHLLSHEHRLLWLIFLLLFLQLHNIISTEDSDENKSYSFGNYKPNRASFFFLKMLFSTVTIFENLMGGRSGFFVLR